jgi:hypothetical protein
MEIEVLSDDAVERVLYPALFENTLSHDVVLAANPYCGVVVFEHESPKTLAYMRQTRLGEVVTLRLPFEQDTTWRLFENAVVLDATRVGLRSGVII